MSSVARLIKVGIADVKMAKSPEKLRTSGLGSCVGVVLYDETLKVAGMAHVMLPESAMAKSGDINRAKYADTAIEDLFQSMMGLGALKFRLRAKMAGGAQMFQFTSGRDLMRVGPRNIEAVKQKLFELGIPVTAEDTGGSSGRTIVFDTDTSQLQVKKVGQKEEMM
ncbi:chemotaxis protein CheD [Halobacillus fulvus]|nr:chemotaxis protein CheD [Halobacillus fulvus]